MNPRDNKSSNWEIGTFAGLSFALNSFGENSVNTELSQILKDSYKTKLGYSTSIHAYWHKKDKQEKKEIFHIKTGLEFFEHQSEFNIIHVSETIITRPGFSGQQEFIPATATRTIVHDNKFRYLSIPMEIGLQHSYKKFNIGISSGLGLNYFISQKGKSMNQDNDIREINNANEGDTPYRKVFLSYHISPFMTYDLTEKTGIRLNSNLRYQNYGKSKFYGLNQSSVIIGFNVGLVYKL